MNAKRKAKQASLNNTEARVEKVIARSEDQNNIVLPTTFEGVDPDTGRDKFKTPDQCDGDAVALGKVITTGQLRVGEVVLARTTEGDRRLDKKTSFSRSSDCGDGGVPGQRGYASIVQANNEAEELAQAPESEFENSDTPPACPQGSIKTDSVQFIGKAKVYERYTGSYTQNSDGTYTCDTEEVTEPNAVPDSELVNTDTGCVSPLEESGAQPLKRCQWFDATEEEALNYTGCPDGMFNTGFTEFPEGSYKILCCTTDDSPAPEQGIGAEWVPASAGETGSAIASTNYCSGYYGAELFVNGDLAATTNNPPISYSVTPSGSGIRVDWGGGDVDVLTGETWTLSGTITLTTTGTFYALSLGCSPSTFTSVDTFSLVAPATFSYASALDNTVGCFSATGIQTSRVDITGVDSQGNTQTVRQSVGSSNLNSKFDLSSYSYTYTAEIVVTTNTGQTSSRTTTTPPSVSLIDPSYLLTVNDLDGEILLRSYTVEPTVDNVRYVCRTNTKVC